MSPYFRVYRSWKEETAALSAAEKGRLMDALVEYIRTGTEKIPKGNERYVYPHMIDRIKREQKTSVELREAML